LVSWSRTCGLRFSLEPNLAQGFSSYLARALFTVFTTPQPAGHKWRWH
jgi:hypothetical protein